MVGPLIHLKTPRAMCVVLCLAVQAALGNNDLNQLYPVEWRAVPLVDAIRDLSERLNVPYVLDTSVTEDVLKQPVRLVATRLSGRQAFRWTVRAVGLDAVLVDGAMVIAKPERLPRVWRAIGSDGSGGIPSPLTAVTQSPEEFEARLADLDWVDAPLSRVCRDISAKFGLDIVFHPTIMAAEPLIRLEGKKLNFQAVRRAFAEQIKASSRYEDGALWIEPAQSTTSQASLEQPEPTPVPRIESPRPLLLNRPIRIDSQGLNWKVLEQQFSQSGDVVCRIKTAPGAEYPALAARCTVSEAMSGMGLLAGWTWQLEPPRPGEKPILTISVPAAGVFGAPNNDRN